MYYTIYQILWLFLIYSFFGWVGETTLFALRKGHLRNRGFLSLPFSPIYGCGWVLFALFLPELKATPFYLYLGGMILATGLELFTGIALEHLTGRKWWDYSDQRFQFEGHICLPYALLWGAAALVCLFLTDHLLLTLVSLIPALVGKVLLAVIYILLAVDFVVSITTVLHVRLSMRLPQEMSQRMRQFTTRLDNTLTRAVRRRIHSAYPTLNNPQTASPAEADDGQGRFAHGLCFAKLATLFFIASFLGAMIEMVFCRITGGTWMSRSSVVWGQFSIVWGLGATLFTAVLYRHRHSSDANVFLLGTVLGGAYEYICSVFTEIVFGTVFWDYSHMPFNLGGRINLLYCFFWGIAAVVWLKHLYPIFSDCIERIPQRIGNLVLWVLIGFMVIDVAVTSLALFRYTQRQSEGATTANPVFQFVDQWFPDDRIEHRYPNLSIVTSEDALSHTFSAQQ